MQTAVRLLILARSNPAAAERLLESHPEALTQTLEMGNTPLHVAASLGHRDSLLFLLRRGAPREACNLLGRTPLAVASECGQPETARALLEAGAFLEAADRQQSRPLHMAASTAAVEVVQLLLESGASVDPSDHLRFTPLFHALHVAPQHLTLQVRDWSEQQRAGTSLPPLPPLDYAEEDTRRCQVVELLLAAGADLTHVGACGQTALHRAAEVAHLCPGMYRLLLERGADPTRLDDNGEAAVVRLKR